MKERVVTFRLDEKIFEDFKSYCEEKESLVSIQIRKLIKNLLREEEHKNVIKQYKY